MQNLLISEREGIIHIHSQEVLELDSNNIEGTQGMCL
jgi:hypothetical protein